MPGGGGSNKRPASQQVGGPVLWVDSASADFHEESILVVMWSGSVELPRRMSRAAFRDFIENGQRMLADADLHDQQQVAHIGKPAKRGKRGKRGKHN